MSFTHVVSRTCRRPRVGLLVAAAVWLLAAPGQARAELVVLSCVGTEVASYSPGLTNTLRPTDIHVHGVVGPCVGLPLGVGSAIYDAFAQGSVSCTSGTVVLSSFVISWSDGTASNITPSGVIVQRLVGQVVRVETSTVTGGRFLGATIVRTSTLLDTGFLACGTPEGVPAVAGPVTLTVIGS